MDTKFLLFLVVLVVGLFALSNGYTGNVVTYNALTQSGDSNNNAPKQYASYLNYDYSDSYQRTNVPLICQVMIDRLSVLQGEPKPLINALVKLVNDCPASEDQRLIDVYESIAQRIQSSQAGVIA